MRHHKAFIKNINNNTNPQNLAKVMYHGKIINFPDNNVSINEAINYWKTNIDTIIKATREIDDKDILTIRYEDILFEPKKFIKEIFQFLKLKTNTKYFSRAIQIPRPFPERSQVNKVGKQEYNELYSTVKNTMNKFDYPYIPKQKKDLKSKFQEFYRGRNHFIGSLFNAIKGCKSENK
jgi:hypothetical protein